MPLNRGTRLLTVMVTMAVRTAHPGEPAIDSRDHQFIGFDSFGDFAETNGSRSGERVLTSPVMTARIDFTEIIVSWNTTLPRDGSLVIEARAVYPEHLSRYYTLGLWANDPSQHPRKSVAGQKDPDGNVSTDTLVLCHAARRLQVRLTIAGESAAHRELKFLGISLTDTNFMSSELAPRREAWGKVLAVPERTQMIYPNGKTLCSPTTVSMLMAYWAQNLKQPELDRDVPEIAAAIYDSQWQGTGNWPFNMAYAGSFPGVRAYVTRFGDISELEAWIERGLPVGLSVDYDRLRAKGPGPNGHLVVLVGFTTEGNPIINDPGTSKHVRKVFPRRNLFDAWACSRNTVYLVYPENFILPEDRFGHWDSAISRSLQLLSH
jgi:hypothetical protein